MEIRSLDAIPFDDIYDAFSGAFADYEMQLGKEELREMVQRRGYDPALSFAAFDGGRIVAFTLNGTGEYGGVPTAYDTGTGTLKEYRGRGLATQVFDYSIPFLKAAGVSQYLLEVLQHNTKAVSVYRNIGFTVTREFNYFRQKAGSIINDAAIPESITVRRIGIEDLPRMESFCDFRPSWQNSLASIRRAGDGFVCLGAFDGDEITGHAVFEPSTGDITQLAVAKPHRRKGVGSALLAEMLRLNQAGSIKVINAETGCETITGFLSSKNIPVAGTQFEMVRRL